MKKLGVAAIAVLIFSAVPLGAEQRLRITLRQTQRDGSSRPADVHFRLTPTDGFSVVKKDSQYFLFGSTFQRVVWNSQGTGWWWLFDTSVCPGCPTDANGIHLVNVPRPCNQKDLLPEQGDSDIPIDLPTASPPEIRRDRRCGDNVGMFWIGATDKSERWNYFDRRKCDADGRCPCDADPIACATGTPAFPIGNYATAIPSYPIVGVWPVQWLPNASPPGGPDWPRTGINGFDQTVSAAKVNQQFHDAGVTQPPFDVISDRNDPRFYRQHWWPKESSGVTDWIPRPRVEATGTANQQAVFVDGTWYMAFTEQINSSNQNGDYLGSDTWRIMWAKSKDGQHWKIQPAVLFRSTRENKTWYEGLISEQLFVDRDSQGRRWFYLLAHNEMGTYWPTFLRAPVDTMQEWGYTPGGWEYAQDAGSNEQYRWAKVPDPYLQLDPGDPAYLTPAPIMASVGAAHVSITRVIPQGGSTRKYIALITSCRPFCDHSQGLRFYAADDLSSDSAPAGFQPQEWDVDLRQLPPTGGNGWEVNFTSFPATPDPATIDPNTFDVWFIGRTGNNNPFANANDLITYRATATLSGTGFAPRIALTSADGRHLSVVNGGTTIAASANTPGDHETFIKIELSDTNRFARGAPPKVALLALNGMYVSADAADHVVRANGDYPYGNQLFRSITLASGAFALQALNGGGYMSVDGSLSPTIGPEETFTSAEVADPLPPYDQQECRVIESGPAAPFPISPQSTVPLFVTLSPGICECAVSYQWREAQLSASGDPVEDDHPSPISTNKILNASPGKWYWVRVTGPCPAALAGTCPSSCAPGTVVEDSRPIFVPSNAPSGTSGFRAVPLGTPLPVKHAEHGQPPVESREVYVSAGDVVTLTAPDMDGAVSWVWYSGSDPLNPGPPLSTQPTYAVTAAAGLPDYWVRVSDAAGNPLFDSAPITISTASVVSITASPAGAVLRGSTFELTALTSLTGNLSYEWHQGAYVAGNNIGTGPSLSWSLFQDSVFWVRVTARDPMSDVVIAMADSALLPIATVVCDQTLLTVSPVSQIVPVPAAGQSVTLTATAYATGDGLSYRWIRDADNVVVATGPTLSVTFTSTDAGSHTYHVDITTAVSGCGGASAPVTFTLQATDLAFYTRSGDQVIYPGGGMDPLYVSVFGSGTLTFEWFHGINGAATSLGPGGITTIADTTMSSMNVGFVAPWDAFWCVVTQTQNGVVTGRIVSQKMYISLYGSCPLPPVSISPAAPIVTPGTLTTLTAICDWPHVGYQWYVGVAGDTRNPMTGQTNNTVTVDSTSRNYWCRVTSECHTTRDSATVSIGTQTSNGTCGPAVIAQQPQSVDIAKGDPATLSVTATDAFSGMTYDWFDPTGIIGSGPQITVQPPQTTTYSVRIMSNCSIATWSVPVRVHVRSCSGITVTTQPGNAIMTAGSVANLSVVATSADTISYKWYAGENGDTSVAVADGEKASIIVSPAVTTSYWVRMWTSTCTIDSTSAVVEVCTPTAIVRAPRGADLRYGQRTTLSVQAQGTNLRYEWRTGTPSNPGQVLSTSDVFWLTPSDTATYFVKVTGDCGTVTSDPVVVHVCTSPAITTQPAAPPTIYNGATATLNVVAWTSTSEPLTYQWYLGETGDDSAPISGATGASYTTVALTTDTSYWVRVSTGSACTPADSATATVPVCALPQNVGTPSTIQTAAGQTVRIYSPVTANQYIFYQGPSGDTSHILNSVNNPYYDVAPTVTTQYWNQVNNYVCVANSATTTVSVCIPTITGQPTPPTSPQAAGTAVTLSVTATPSSGLTYQWYSGASGDTSAPLAGQTGSSVIVSPTVTTAYWVRVSGSCSHTADSNTATVPVCTTTTVTGSSPSNQWVSLGYSTLLSVSASGSALTYQWYTGNPGDPSHPIAGATFPQYAATPSNTTTYWVLVSSVCGNANSPAMTVSVCAQPTIKASPQNASAWSGGTATLSVTASNTVTNPNSYQWYQGAAGNTSTPVGTNSPIFTTPALSATTSYWVRVSNGTCPTADSTAATVTVTACPSSEAAAADVQSQVGQSVALTVPSSVVGTPYASLQLSGSAYVRVNNAPALAVSGPITVEAWVRLNAAGGSAGIVEYLGATSSGNGGYGIRISGGKAYFYVGYDTPDSSQMTSIAGATTVSAGAWHHIAGVYDGSQVRVYLDGVLDGSKSAPNGPGSGTENLVIGIYGNEAAPAGYFNGLIDEARVTADALYFNNFAPAQHFTTSTATVGFWNFDNRSLADASANGLGGTAAGSVAYLEDVPGAKQYQWYQGASGTTTTPVGAATAATTLTVAPAATTQYWYQLRDGSCTSNSGTTTVNVCVPTITTQPTGTGITQGQSAPLTVAASPAGVTYQWYTGAAGVMTSPVANGATASITVSPTTTTSYWARATSTCGRTADSNAVTVAVCNPPSVAINSVPSWWIARGGTVQLNLTSSGSGLTYQWYTGNPNDATSPISGATGTSYTAAPQNTTSYWVKASGQCGTANSNGVTIHVCVQPTITTQPAAPSTIYNGATATLNVVASTSTSEPLTYQWYLGATGDTSAPISGATAASYTTVALTTDTSYWVRVSNGSACATADSATVTVPVCALPQNVGSPSTIQSAVGQTVRINSPVTANQYIFYQGASGDTSHILNSVNNPYYDVAPTVTTQYWNQVNNYVCVANSATTTVNVCIPTFTTQPGSPTISSGTSATLTSVANTAGVTYQWYNGASGNTASPISGATGASYTTPTLTSAASYWVRATGSCGRTTDSSTANVSICQAPTVTMNTSGTWWIARGSSMNINASGSGTGVTYQWYTGNSGITTSPVSGATSLTYTASPQNTTSYWVQATGQCGTANSAAFTVNVCAPPTINTQPVSVTIYNSSSATLTVSASDVTTTPVTYQWYVGTSGDTTSPIAGATGASYTTPLLTGTMNYWVRALNGTCTTADSTTATVTVCAYTQTVGSPQTLYSSPGQIVRVMSPVTNASQYVFYVGNSGDMSHILSSTNNYYYDVAPTVTTNYWNTVNNYVCTANSATTTVNVCIPQMTTQPASVTITSGSATTLTAAANTAGVTYQWYLGTSGTTTSPIAGATGASYTTPALTANTSYWVRATSSCGRTVDSSTATVTICAATQLSQSLANAVPVGYNQYSTLRVYASGSNLTYQWYIGQSGDTSHPYPNATSTTFTILAQQSELYWVRVSGTCGTVDSNAAFISVYATIRQQPQDQYLTSGSYGYLSVGATGTYLHYKWYYDNGTPIPGVADAPNASTPPLTASVGVYCVVTSGAAPWNTNGAMLNLCDETYAATPVVYPGSGNCRTLYAQGNGSTFQWYQGQRGDVSTPLGYYYYQTVCTSTSTTYWVREWSTDSNGNSCYADSSAVTAP